MLRHCNLAPHGRLHRRRRRRRPSPLNLHLRRLVPSASMRCEASPLGVQGRFPLKQCRLLSLQICLPLLRERVVMGLCNLPTDHRLHRRRGHGRLPLPRAIVVLRDGHPAPYLILHSSRRSGRPGSLRRRLDLRCCLRLRCGLGLCLRLRLRLRPRLLLRPGCLLGCRLHLRLDRRLGLRLPSLLRFHDNRSAPLLLTRLCKGMLLRNGNLTTDRLLERRGAIRHANLSGARVQLRLGCASTRRRLDQRCRVHPVRSLVLCALQRRTRVTLRRR